ncbi:hypothetical protein [Streptomyces sp. NPDC058579]|uniref:hypothetical protein n=1 Tax=Streptomyces sp. NPDC058579 TaxID=3346548 RepID=UPI00365588DF
MRRILVHSTGNAEGQQRARDKRLAKAREDLDKLQHSAGGRYYNTTEKIAARIGVTITRTPAGSPAACTPRSPRTRLGGPPCPGTSTRTYSRPKPPSTAGTRC